MATLTVLTHVEFEGPARIADWAAGRNHPLRPVRLWAGDALPSVDEVEALVIMGGPMSVNDEARFPWLKPEKALVRAAVRAGRPVLGVCLGAQLIADALGGSVTRNPAGREIGWWPVSAAGADARFPIPDGLTLFHWHGEVCEPPADAVILASTPACAVQAFRVGETCLALQCHAEMDAPAIAAIIRACADELAPGQPRVQTRAELEAGLRAAGPMRRWLESTLDRWIHAPHAGSPSRK